VTASIFSGTADYYAKYRPRYPQSMLDDLVTLSVGTRGRSMVDLGCGTGEVALPLSSSFNAVTAIDIDAAMIALAEAKAHDDGIRNVRFQVGAAEELKIADSTADLVVAGSSFHWMDRDALAPRIYGWLTTTGIVAILGGGSDVWDVKAGWHEVAVAAMRHWLGERRRAGSGDYAVTKLHADFLEPAGFSLESRHYHVEHVWNADTIFGYLSSTSFASPQVLGDKAEAFEADLRARLHELSPDDEFPETLDFYAVIGRK
jgi:SAM-dependent methyltransferase